MSYVLITGSSSGLGAAIACNLSNYHKVMLTGRSEEALLQQIEKLNSDKFKHEFYVIDFLKDKEVVSFLNYCDQNKIIFDTIIHNLGGVISGDGIHPIGHEILMKSFKFNLGISVQLNQFFLPIYQQVKAGKIIYIGSDSSLTGKASPAYVASKAAINGYVKSCANYYAQFGVVFCAILPPIIDHETSSWRKKKEIDNELYNSRKNQLPAKRFAKTEDIVCFITNIVNDSSIIHSGNIYNLNGIFS